MADVHPTQRQIVALAGASGAVYGVRPPHPLSPLPPVETHLLASSAGGIETLNEVAGLPAGVLNPLGESGHEVAQALVESPAVDVIGSTASNANSQKSMAAAARTMTKLSLELGGKSCCLVFDDIGVTEVATQAAAAATITSDRQSSAAHRVLVQSSRFHEMGRALTQALCTLVAAPGDTPDAHMGPVIDGSAYTRVSRTIKAAMDAADEVVLRGGRPADRPASDHFMTPALVAHRATSASFVQDAIVGLFVVLEPVVEKRAAVARVEHAYCGPYASVWTNDRNRALRVAQVLRRATVWIKDHNRAFAEVETVGYRRSGLGCLQGQDTMITFVEIRDIYQTARVVRRPNLRE